MTPRVPLPLTSGNRHYVAAKSGQRRDPRMNLGPLEILLGFVLGAGVLFFIIFAAVRAGTRGRKH